MALLASTDLVTEYDHQLQRLVDLGFPALAGLAERTFKRRTAGLRAVAGDLGPATSRGPDASRLPFVLVVPRSLVPTEDALALVEQGKHRGYVGMAGARPLDDYHPIQGLVVPPAPYLAVDVDLGDPKENLPPEQGLTRITSAGRSPLTIDEGTAVLTQRPGVLRAVTQFWAMGSRSGDRRVPAFWVSQGAPRLGWCWAGTPHDWLGAASCARRVAADSA